MYCPRCDEHHFGGSVCPSCGGKLLRGRATFTPHGTPMIQRANIAVYQKARGRAAAAAADKTGQAEGLLVRLCYKLLESVFACVAFSVALRLVIFLVKVIDSMLETGGEIKEGISLYSDIRMAIGRYEIAMWIIIAILIFRYRHNPD